MGDPFVRVTDERRMLFKSFAFSVVYVSAFDLKTVYPEPVQYTFSGERQGRRDTRPEGGRSTQTFVLGLTRIFEPRIKYLMIYMSLRTCSLFITIFVLGHQFRNYELMSEKKIILK